MLAKSAYINKTISPFCLFMADESIGNSQLDHQTTEIRYKEASPVEAVQFLFDLIFESIELIFNRQSLVVFLLGSRFSSCFSQLDQVIDCLPTYQRIGSILK